MITGVYDQTGGEYISASVYFPAPVDRTLRISFLVDSGAAKTCLSITDLVRLGQTAFATIPLRPSPISFRGIGGGIRPSLTTAGILLVHDDGGFTSLALDLALILEPSFVGMPSLLGRDILFLGDTRLDSKAGQVTLDLPQGSWVL